MAYMIGQCATAPVPPVVGNTGGTTGGVPGGSTGGTNTGSTAAGGSALNEPIPFFNVRTFDLNWDSTMRAKFGTHGDFAVYIIEDDGLVHLTSVAVSMDNISAPTVYHFDFGGPFTGVIICT